MIQEPALKLFVSSPGDVQRERERIDYVVERLNAEYAGRVRIDTIRWETKYYSSHDTFQAQIPEAAECDLVVAVFGSRLGSPLPEAFPRMPSGESYPSGSAYEVLSAMDARRKGQGVPDIYVFRRPSAPMVALDAADRAEIETQWRRLASFFETWFRNRGGQFLAAFQEFGTTDEFAVKVEDCLRQWLTRRGYPPKATSWDRRKFGSPYPGLAAFDESRQAVFFGRALVIDQALRRLRDAEATPAEAERAPFLLLIGASGSGKSSLLRAGLLPRVGLPGVLPEVDLWRRVVMAPGLNPFETLAGALLAPEALGAELARSPFRTRELLAKQLAGDPDVAIAPLRDALAAAADERRREGGFETARAARLFLALDQAERLLLETPLAVQTRFAELIAALCRGRIATVLVALRSDAYPRFQALDAFVALRAAGATLDLLPATASELEEMATRPAALCEPPLAFERRSGRSLASVLVADAEGGDALPLLQMTLARLSSAEAGRGDGVLRFEDYHGLGEAVSRTANDALVGLDPAARAQLPNLIVGLVRDYAPDPATGKTIPVIGALDRARFEEGRPERKTLIEAFVANRLLTAEGDAASQRVRPTHESLLRIWPEAVAILAEAAQLIRARAAIEPLARDWAEATAGDKARHLEVSPALLEGAIAYVARFGEEVAPRTRAFVAEAAEIAEQRRQREREEQERRIADAEAIARANRRIALASGAGLAAALVLAGLAGWQWRESVRAQTEAQIQRDRAERALAAATATADGLVFDLAQKFRDVTGVPKGVVKDVLDQARKLQEQLMKSGEASAKLTSNHAAALGETAITELALGDAEQALALALQSRDVYADLLKSAPNDVKYVYDLAHTEDIAGGVYRQQGKMAGAEAAYQRARSGLESAMARGVSDPRLRQLQSTIVEDLGALARARGDSAGALALYREGLQLAKALADAAPDDMVARHDWAIAQRSLGDVELDTDAVDAAIADFNASSVVAQKLAQEYPENSLLQRDYSLSQERLGQTLTKKGDLAGALKAFSDGEDTAIGLAKTDPANLDWQYDIAIGHIEVGDTQMALGDLAGAAASYRAAAGIDKALTAKDPSNVLWRRHNDDALQRWADALEKSGDAEGAATQYREAAAFAEKAMAANGPDPDWMRRALRAGDRLGVLLLAAGKTDEALAAFGAAEAKALALGNDRSARENQLAGYIHIAGALSLKGDAGSALDHFAKAARIARDLIAEDPKEPGPRGELALLLVSAAHVQSRSGKGPEAVAGLREAVTLCEALQQDQPRQTLWRRELSTAYDRLGDVLRESGDASGAIEAYRNALAVADALPAAETADRGSRLATAMTEEALSPLLDAKKQVDAAIAALRRAIEVRRGLFKASPDDNPNARVLMVDDNALGRQLSASGKTSEGLAAYRDGLELARALAAKAPSDPVRRHDLAIALFLVGSQLGLAHDSAGAAAHMTEALPLAVALAEAAPKSLTYRRFLAIVARNLAAARMATPDLSGALQAIVVARDADQATMALDGSNPTDADQLKADVTQIGLVANAMLIARDYPAALAAIDSATPAAPDQNWFDLVRALALMPLDRADEAKALILKHRGELTYGGKTWEFAVLDSFSRLRASGVSYPLMDEIQAVLSAAK